MTDMKQYPAGTFCWEELGTSDSEGAKKFYTELFGWEADDNPIPPDMVYTIFKLDGKNASAMYQLTGERKGIPPHWLSYVSVDNADETAEQAQSLGGNVMAAPFSVFDIGRMAVIQDPTGAVFAIWQPLKHIGAQVANVPGAFCWNELLTNDKARAAEFYEKLFKWTTEAHGGGHGEYTEFFNNGRPAGGMMEIQPEWGQVPPHWGVYFAVSDCDKTAEHAKSLGASIIAPPTDIPNVGRFSVIRDPQGAVFSVIKLNQMPA